MVEVDPGVEGPSLVRVVGTKVRFHKTVKARQDSQSQIRGQTRQSRPDQTVKARL